LNARTGEGVDMSGKLDRPEARVEMTQKISLALFWMLLALILFSTLSPVQLRPQFGRPALERAGGFIALAAALGVSYPRRPFLVALAICSIAIGSEALQLLIPSRHARLIDGGEKMAGSLVGAAAVAVVSRAWRRP
jgi:hypothetical protein